MFVLKKLITNYELTKVYTSNYTTYCLKIKTTLKWWFSE